MLKRINTVIISPYRGGLETIASCLYSNWFARCLFCREDYTRRGEETSLSRKRESDDARQTRKETIPYRTCSSHTPLSPYPFLSFFLSLPPLSFSFSPDLFSAIAIMAHRDAGAYPSRRWQIRKERPFKLECDPWDGHRRR